MKTTCTYLTGSSSLVRLASQLLRALVWHFGNGDRQELNKGGGLIAALAAAIQVATERCRAAVLDGEQHTQMKTGQPGSVLFDKSVAKRANDIGHLERWPAHFCPAGFLCSLRERFT